jgi:hypothetical protein
VQPGGDGLLATTVATQGGGRLPAFVFAAIGYGIGMYKGIIPGVLVLALAVLNPGCESTNAVMKPTGEVAVPLDATKKRGAVNVRLANLLTFTMPPAAPGLNWEISFHDTRFLKLQTPVLPPKVAGEGSTVTFMAINLGTTRLRFVLVPVSTAQAVAPVDQQDINVVIR